LFIHCQMQVRFCCLNSAGFLKKKLNACSKGRDTSSHVGSLYLNFHQKWSELGTLSQTDAKEAEIKKS
jgi:hypothetical protein